MFATQPVIVISSAHISHALLDGRSATTSDRPPKYMSYLITKGKDMIHTRNCKLLFVILSIAETDMIRFGLETGSQCTPSSTHQGGSHPL